MQSFTQFSESNQFDDVRTLIQKGDRVISTAQLLTSVRTVEQQAQADRKPRGLWYGVGTDWIDWLEFEMPHWLNKYLYKINISSRVLRITTPTQLQEFNTKYRKLHDGMQMIQWTQVAQRHPGIEIAPYQRGFSLDSDWYRSWDVASGCVWDAAGASGFIKLR